jgi:hypothetical protein
MPLLVFRFGLTAYSPSFPHQPPDTSTADRDPLA